MPLTTAELGEWFLERRDDPPRKTHQRGVWVDRSDRAASVLGSPDWTHAWTRWLYAPPHALMVESFEDVCYHAGQLPGQPCPSCTVVREDGSVLYTTGVVTRHRLRYRWPMRLVIHRLWRSPARPPRPNLGSVLWALMVADGDVGRASTALAVRWPAMADPDFALAVTRQALRRARTLYREDAELIRPQGKKPKSDAQLDAEADLRRHVGSSANGESRPQRSSLQRDELAGRLLSMPQP